MPTDLTTMTTLDLLRELEARGWMPAGWKLLKTIHYPLILSADGLPWGHSLNRCEWRWYDGGAERLQVALQDHLAGMGVATEMIPDCDGHPLWCCRPVLRSGAVEGSTVSYRVDKAPVFGPGVDGLLRAAVGALREVQGG